MRFGINLRGDLAKLSDTEIAAKLENLIGDRESMYHSVPATFGNKGLYQSGWGKPFGRGPLHARIFYQFFGLPYLGSSLYDLYLLDCELKDTRDEIARRVKLQRTELATK
jgi:hypothetical protein